MTRVFIFEDTYDHSYDPLIDHLHKVDINKELELLEKEGWKIKNVEHQIIYKYEEYYGHWDKDIFTVIVEKENKYE